MATITPVGVPSLDIDLYDPGLVDDPWPALSRIREAGPLVWNEQGYWMTAHDRMCRKVFSKPNEMGQDGLMKSFFGVDAFIAIDDRSRHNALRDVWVAAFGQDGVDRLVPVVRRVVGEMLDAVEDELRSGGQVDMIPALCRPLPAHIIAHMMGVSNEMTSTVIAWADTMASATLGGLPIDYDTDPYWLASERAKSELADYLIEQIRYRRTDRCDDLINHMVHSEVGQKMSEAARMVNIRQLLFAGNETTSNWLGHIAVTFGERRADRQALVADQSLVPGGVEEVLRWQGVTQVMPRGVGGEGANIAGHDLPPGAEVILLLGAAGRDPKRWDRPDIFDMQREPKPHLAFGNGMHTCLGAILARMEAVEVTNALLDRFPEYRIARSVSYANFSLRGPTSVWIELCSS